MEEEVPKDLLQDAWRLAAELRATLNTRLLPADTSRTSKTAFKVRMLREAILHRLSDLADAACASFASDRLMAGFVLTRAAFETMALLFYLQKSLQSAIDKHSASEVDDLAMRTLMGTKAKDSEFQAVNILTALKHLEKEVEGMEDLYAELCEFAHPNFHGVMMFYAHPTSHLDHPYAEQHLGRGGEHVGPDFGLQCLRIAIMGGGSYSSALARLDQAVIRLCEEQPEDG